MLKSVHLKNFKLHEDTLIEAAPITVFIGPNNSGKSSIFQVLLCLRDATTAGSSQLVEPAEQRPHQIIDLGSFPTVVRAGQKEIQVSVSGVVDPGASAKYKPRSEVGVRLGVTDNVLTSSTGTLQNDYGKVQWSWMASSPWPPTGFEMNVGGLSLFFSPAPNFRLLDTSGFRSTPGVALPPPERQAEIHELHRNVAGAPSYLLRSVHPVFPLRGFEEWGYLLPEKKPGDLDLLTLGQRAVALAGMLAYDRDLEERVSQRLTELLSVRVKVRLVEGKRVTMWAEPSGIERPDTLFVNEGTGANQVPFILIPVALTPRNETVLLSEPEVHLHPKGQCDLTRMLLTVAKKENMQFFIETHSEHVLHVILNAVAKGEWAKEDVALHYFENVEGKAQVKRLGINEHGQVDGGLPGFFDQSLTELTEYLGALGKR